MYCDRNIGFCVSREQPSRTYQGNPVLARKVAKANGLAEGKFGRAFKLTRRDKRVRGDSVTLPKMKMKLVWVKRFKTKRDVYRAFEILPIYSPQNNDEAKILDHVVLEQGCSYVRQSKYVHRYVGLRVHHLPRPSGPIFLLTIF
jgi:hypothetical protein